MNNKLFITAMSRLLLGFILTAALLFIPAGTINYWNGWLLIIVLFIPMFVAGVVMMLKDPSLLKKRLNMKENEREQKIVIALSGFMFVVAFILAGFNFRYKWLMVPKSIVWTSVGLFLLGYIIYAEVLRENSFLSRTVEIQENQRVIDTGLYGIVRHPMYFATLLIFLSMPLILGSPISILILLFYIPIIDKRIKNEEEVLGRGLEGYSDYTKKVKFKMIPFIW
ncbi:MAG: isoprenylcysteine carboxylmethyltransferase family protein [Tissierellia bacterium]|nr:isoprenylcysteine carboxylmethyltransferase family protein [Tissierellia bacterium]